MPRTDPMFHAVGSNFGANSLVNPQARHVGRRSQLPTSGGGSTTIVYRRTEFASDDIDEIAVGFTNIYYDATGPRNAVARTISVAIKYPTPADVVARITWNGATTATMAAGLRKLISDFVRTSRTIPKGARFYIDSFYTGAAGLGCSGYTACTAIGDGIWTSSTLTPEVVTTNWAVVTGGNPFMPVVVLSRSYQPAVMALVDSLGIGANATSDSAPFVGILAPGIAPFMAYGAFGAGGQTLQQFADGTMAPVYDWAEYFTTAILQPSVNDITAGRSVAQMIADIQAIQAKAPALDWWKTTTTPVTASTDSWATLANQAVDGFSAIRVGLNLQIRAGVVGKYLDSAFEVSSEVDSVIWKASPMVPGALTDDGKHPINKGQFLASRAMLPLLAAYGLRA